MALSDVIGRLAVNLTMDTAAFSTGVGRASKDAKNLGDRAEAMGNRVGKGIKTIAVAGTALAGAFAIGYIKDAIKSGLDFASGLQEQATQIGVTTQALQQYRYAATQIGIDQGELDKGLTKLGITLGKLSSATDKQKDAFVKYGLTAADVDKLSKSTAEQAIPLLADKFAALTSPTEKAALAAEFFGSKLGAKFNTLLEGGSAGVNELTKAANSLGIVLSDKQIQDADKTADKISELQLVLQARISGAVSDNAASILELVNALIKLVEYAGKAARAWRLYTDVITTGRTPLQSALRDLGPGVQLTFSPEELAARRLAPAINGRAPSSLQKSTGSGFGSVPQFLRKTKGNFAPGVGPTKFAANDLAIEAGQNTAALKAFDKAATSAAGKASDTLAPSLKKLSAEAKKTADDLKHLAAEGAALIDRLFPQEAADRQYVSDLALLDSALKRGTLTLEKYAEARRLLSSDSLGGSPNDPVGESVFLFDNVDQITPNLDAIDHALGKLKGFHDTTADGIEATNVRVVKSFADTAQATLSSLQSLTNAIKGGGFLNILSAVVGFGLQLGGIGAFGKTLQTRINAPGRAIGGPVTAGRAYTVGERGRELFVPGQSGRIISNDNLRGGGSTRVDVIPSPYFQVAVNGQIQRAAPALVGASVAEVGQRQARAQSRRVG